MLQKAATACCHTLRQATVSGPRLRRRELFRFAGLGAAAALGLAGLPARAATGPKTDLTPDQALKVLREGNEKFLTDGPFRAAQGRERRIEIARAQVPFAVLVSCSDSRVPPELLFGRGLGELFIVRNAGNTIDTTALGSIEYGVLQLGCPLVVVLGHERCGAVEAAVAVVKDNAKFPGSIGQMIEPIIPAVLDVRHESGDLVENSVRANVRRVTQRLRQSEAVLLEPIRSGKLKIVGARYDLDDGDVDFFDGV
jgi:carbonic anhydrase